MTIDIICVGKIKEKFYTEAIEEYKKRLSKFANINIYEVKDEKTKENASSKEDLIVLEKEAERIIKHLSDSSFKYMLCIEGTQKGSEDFSKEISSLELNGKSHIQFVIGGSLGLHDSIKQKADNKISFSKMTFPHQLMRVILLEQIYRAYKIKNKEPYHK